MKPGEIIRIIVLTVLGWVLMFYGQPLIYQSRLIRVADVPLTTWLSDYYTVGAWVVFLASVGATLVWTFMTTRAKASGALDVFRWQVVWWLLGLLPILGICIALYFFNESDDALLSLAGFFIFNGLFWLYWLPTVTSSPGLFRNIPPGSPLIRRLIG
ncbi:hypothetical protein [Gloeothece verrucosa]|uniref:Uncharacterized protein n=1 Tax=Gloeothece verrucosa (strain PCC 7822) TaxID=497965 RepID=E0UNW6_GLOV7|nr:hypothetical protein [Gloeothece verrucosa]ADN18646.1 hypothetical protein Cyan7822_6701 [Gloeothece verrucosa PCC 7822]